VTHVDYVIVSIGGTVGNDERRRNNSDTKRTYTHVLMSGILRKGSWHELHVKIRLWRKGTHRILLRRPLERLLTWETG